MDIIKYISKTLCWKCNGRGNVYIPSINDEDLSVQEQAVTCPICGGRGYIEIVSKKIK
jgi:DnaJ-class molecular chaperone